MEPTEEELGELFEALSIERLVVPGVHPPFTGYGDRPEYWDWLGGWQMAGPGFDIEYRNTDGKRHRLYGPAYISKTYKAQEWYKDGIRHRENGPAYIHKNNMVWFYEGVLHRLDGPAVIEGGGPKQYWIHGVRYSKKQYEWEIKRMRRKGLIK